MFRKIKSILTAGVPRQMSDGEARDVALMLLEKVCGYDYMGETNIIDVYVRYLRSKLDDVYNVKIIQTVRGVGYCIKDEQ